MATYKDRHCKWHGETRFRLNGKYYVCIKCFMLLSNRRRLYKKKALIDLFGGKCKLCDYSKYIGALEFHHINPETKLFGINTANLDRSWKVLLKEVAKCELLCSNCHKEVHNELQKND